MKNKILFMIYSTLLGGIIGIIVWSFLKIMNLSINFIWNYIPNNYDIPFYTIIVCIFGGLIIGLWRSKVGDYPEELETVITKVKTEGKYSYNKTGIICVSALLPLIFGGSVGPEAGLSGVIAGLCSWVSDKFKKLFKEIKELTSIGMSATIGLIFNSAMFGFVEPIEDEEMTLPKKSKMILYFLAIFGAFSTMLILKNIFGGGSGLERLSGYSATFKEWLYLVPLILLGLLLGFLYQVFHKATNFLAKKLKSTIIKCVIAGLILGVCGYLLPLTMFSGEEQIVELMIDYKNIGLFILIMISIIKLFVTNTCISFGFKGGHFFPCIFSGISLGYACGLLFNVNVIFSVCVITTTLISFILKKSFATVLLLMICFPVKAIPIMLFVAVIGSFISSNQKKEVIKCEKVENY